MTLNELFPDVSAIEIGGELVELKYNVRAIRELEKIYGSWKAVEAMMRGPKDTMTTEDVTNLIYSCMIGAGKPMPREDVADMVESNLGQAWELMVLLLDNYDQSSMTDEQLEKLEVMAFGKKRSVGREIDWAYYYAFVLSKCRQTEEWFMNATMRQLFALMIGVAEINGAKTEIDDAGEF